MAECADDIAFIRSTWTTDNDHGAQLQFHTGRQFFQGYYPSVGSWNNAQGPGIYVGREVDYFYPGLQPESCSSTTGAVCSIAR